MVDNGQQKETGPTETALEGGRPGVIRKSGNRIIRPAGPWSKTIHAFLHHLRQQGFNQAPEPLGFDGHGQESLSFIKGEVFNPPPEGFCENTEILKSAAQLLRRYHYASANFLPPADACWMHPPRDGADVICHGDFAPYNTVFRQGLPAAMIDFDVAHPAPRLWDIAYALYRWVPCGNPDLSPERQPLETQCQRVRLFLEAYGLQEIEWPGAVAAMIERLTAMTDYMKSQAEDGDEKFKADIERGDLALYLGEIFWLRDQQRKLEAALRA